MVSRSDSSILLYLENNFFTIFYFSVSGFNSRNREDKFLYEFSAMIIPLSTITPIASAIPVRDIMLDVIPNALSKIKLVAMVIGICIMMLIALLQWNRNIMTTIDTTIISSISVVLTDDIDS